MAENDFRIDENDRMMNHDNILLICYPRCSTCLKARKHLQASGIDFAQRDIKTNNPTVDELKEWSKHSDRPLTRWFNTSGNLYKEKNLKEVLVTMTDEEKLALLASDGMMVKRPILIVRNTVLVGYQKAEYDQLVALMKAKQ